MQVTGLKPAEPTEPQGPEDQEVEKSTQEIDDGDVLSQKAADDVKEEVKNQEEEEEEEAPASLSKDWTRGSVRRVTRQLEQRMKREHETPSPSSSPPSLSGSSSSSQRRPASVHAATPSNPQNASGGPQVSEVSNVEGEQEETAPGPRRSGDVADAAALATDDKSTKGHKLQPADIPLLSNSSPFRRSARSPFASVNFLCLEGVTELESGTDWDCSAEGPHGDIIMRETWETLCELGAFLQQVSMDGGCKERSAAGQLFGLSAGSTQTRRSGVRKRVKEVEARIRQAGLTPPSLMKRSASLAKLGCLELLANDLSEWELSRCSVAPTSARPLAHTASDEPKKQRVHGSPSSAGEQPAGAQRLSGESSPGASPPPGPQTGKLPNSDQECPHVSGLTHIATRQQYGRTHPLRRLKKTTASSLYHTM